MIMRTSVLAKSYGEKSCMTNLGRILTVLNKSAVCCHRSGPFFVKQRNGGGLMSWWNRKKDEPGPAGGGGDSLPADGPVIRLQGITRIFKGDADEDSVALDNVTVDVQRGRLCLHLRTLGLRQIHAAVGPGPARHADIRALLAEREGRRPHVAGRARPRAQPRCRPHLPELQPDRRHDRLRERRVSADAARREPRRPQAHGGSGPRARRDDDAREAKARAHSQAGTSSSSLSHAPSPAGPHCCWPTSRPATSTRRVARR